MSEQREDQAMLRFFPILAVGALFAAGTLPDPAWAQRQPSEQEMIDSLRRRAAEEDPARGRGLRPARPTQSPPSSGATAPQPRPDSGTAATGAEPRPGTTTLPADEPPQVVLNVRFHTNSAELTPEAMQILDQLGRALNSPALAADRFRIAGHTDTVGPSEYNQRLSERRAAAVLDYISSRFGVDRTRIEAVGRGEEDLLVFTADNTPEGRNRRVQVVNIGN
jgi:outer membrane protein OmpA-like peptidoglycan-associated protein